MNSLNNFHFLRPAWMLLIPLVVCLWRLSRRRLDPLRGWRSIMDPQLLAAMTVGNQNHSVRRGAVLLLGWVAGTVSLAGPTWWPEPSPFADDPVPVMVVLKADESMNLTDLSPDRMERSRLKIADLAKARGNEPLGLIAYAASAHLVLPPTRDTGIVAGMAAAISPDVMPQQGDDLAAALNLAVTTLAQTGGSVVVVLDTVASPAAPELKQFAESNRTPVHLLAIAREDTPEIADINMAAKVLNATVTLITADSQDVQSIVKTVAGSPRAVNMEDDGIRWAEAGWWLVPFLAALSLAGFRRETHSPAEEASR